MRFFLVAAAFAGFALPSGTLMAQQSAFAAAAPSRIELTAFAGLQSGQDFTDEAGGGTAHLESADNAGLILDVGMAPDIQLEFLYSRAKSGLEDGTGARLTDVKVEYLHMGAAYVYTTGHVRPFLAVTLGATRFEPVAGGYDSDTRFSLGLGGGVKLMLTDSIGVRLEARAYATQVDSDSAVFCVNNACRIYYDGDFLMQYAGHAGIVVAF